jgi:hypothetical protein
MYLIKYKVYQDFICFSDKLNIYMYLHLNDKEQNHWETL